MKKHFLPAMAGIFIGSFAMSSAALDLSVGAKGGLAINGFSGDSLPYSWVEKKSQLAFVGGGAIDVMFSPVFGVETDFFFSMKGAKFEGADYIGMRINYSLSYLDIPLVAKLTIPVPSPVKPTVFAGPVLGILLSSKEHGILSNGDTIVIDTIFDMRDRTNAFDLGLVFGAGVEIPAGPGKLIIDIRYSLGLTKIDRLSDEDKKYGRTEADLYDWRNTQIGLMVGYSFKL